MPRVLVHLTAGVCPPLRSPAVRPRVLATVTGELVLAHRRCDAGCGGRNGQRIRRGARNRAAVLRAGGQEGGGAADLRRVEEQAVEDGVEAADLRDGDQEMAVDLPVQV